MNTGINLRISLKDSQNYDIPVKVEILDASLHPVYESWDRVQAPKMIPLQAGVYSVKASVSSGVSSEQVINVIEGNPTDCIVDLDQASPHESHEWAYLTQSLGSFSTKLLSDARYQGLWMRLWKHGTDSGWAVQPFSSIRDFIASREQDGISYTFSGLGTDFFALQFGGPRIPWKIFALPSSYSVRVLVRPSSAPTVRTHPLEVVVASENWEMESLLSLMQSGDMSSAADLVEKTSLAEQFLYGKISDNNAAAVGGYFLLRIGSTKRLREWAHNLADWFPIFPDGAIIHAWQMIRSIQEDPTHEVEIFTSVRQRLIEAVDRGFPLYSEGLRLLRDGLILVNQRANGDDTKITEAMKVVGEYTVSTDWSVSNTAFTGSAPDQPSAKPQVGTPRGKDPLVFVFDVPVKKAISSGVLQPGEELVVQDSKKISHAKVTEQGTVVLEDGSEYKSLSDLESAVRGKASGYSEDMINKLQNKTLGNVMKKLRGS